MKVGTKETGCLRKPCAAVVAAAAAALFAFLLIAGIPLGLRAHAGVLHDQQAVEGSSVPDVVTVQFRQGIGVLGSVPEMPADATINQAFARAGIELPSAGGAGEDCKGWAVGANDDTPLKGYLTLADAYAQAGDDGVLLLYPVFGPVARPHISFYGQDRTTLLSQADIGMWQTISGSGAAPSLTVKDGATGKPALLKLGYRFIGWSDQDGVLCPIGEPLSQDASFYPTYAKLRASFSGVKGASADISKAYLLRLGLEGATRAGFRLSKGNSADEALVRAADADGFAVLSSFRASFSYTAYDEGEAEYEDTLVKSGFGLVTVNLPTSLSDGAKAKLYWLKSDGSVGRSAVKEVSGGSVSLGFADYTSSALGGNVALAYKPSTFAPGTRKTESDPEDSSGRGSFGAQNGSDDADAGSGSGDSGDAAVGSRAAAAAAARNRASGAGPSSDDDSGGPAVASKGASKAKAKTKGGVSSSDGEEGEEVATGESAGLAHKGSKEGGMLYGASMLAIAAAAIAAWWFAFFRGKKRGARAAASQ